MNTEKVAVSSLIEKLDDKKTCTDESLQVLCRRMASHLRCYNNRHPCLLPWYRNTS